MEKAVFQFVCFVMFIITSIVHGQQYIGDLCVLQGTGASGQCLLIANCLPAIQSLHTQGIFPQTCGFNGSQPIVCCVGDAVNSTTVTGTTISSKPTDESISVPSVAITRIGQKSELKCNEYKVHAGSTIVTLTGETYYEAYPNDVVQLIVGGIYARPKEFPHMAAIGFDDDGQIIWQCGGSLISEHYILTAGHCLHHWQFGKPKYVRLGDLILNDDSDDAKPQNFLIEDAIAHPDYRPPSQYNDIALLKLNKDAVLNTYVRPACLNINSTLSALKATASGWGKIDYTTDKNDRMQRIVLEYFSNAECNNLYENKVGKRLQFGIVEQTQLCAGSHNEAKDICQDDSGGPLQIYNAAECMYKLVGVTSFGKTCGIANIPGVYTKISAYIEWIENIVWP